MIVPDRTAVVAFGLLALLLVGAPVFPPVVPVVLLADLSLLAILMLQGRWLRAQHVEIERENWQKCQIDRETTFIFRIENRSPAKLLVAIRQPWPDSFTATVNQTQVEVEPGEAIRVGLEATPRRRGRVEFPPAEIDISLPVGFARYRRLHTSNGIVSVYPQLDRVRDYDVLRQSRALEQVGIHRQRQLGSGREFEKLRDYVPDDDSRDVNWKATARRRRPITNVYQAERSQDVLLCLDASRMMGNPVRLGTALDRAVDASLILAHAAQRQGDRVGLAVFRDTVEEFIKPRTGHAGISKLIDTLVGVVPDNVFPSYAALVSAIRSSQKKRALVFLFTDLNDPQLAGDLAAVLPLVARRHVIAVVSIRDSLLDHVAQTTPSTEKDLLQILAARELAAERAARIRDLARLGVQVLDTDAESLSIKAINAYLTIKSRQLL